MTDPIIHQGMSIPATKRPFLGRSRIRLVIGVLNALLKLRVTRGSSDSFTVSSRGAILQLKRSSDEGSTAPGGLIQLKVMSEQDDYLTCKAATINAAGTISTSGADILVAKPYALRLSIDAEAPTGFGTIIYAGIDPIGGTGVFVSSVELTYIMFATVAGSGSALMFKIVTIAANHYVCHSWDGTTEGVDDILVAKPTKIRNSIASEVIDGDTYDYDYDASTILRTSTGPDSVEPEVVVPHYLAGDVIHALPTADVQMVIDAVDVTLIDLNIDRRGWTRQYLPL